MNCPICSNNLKRDDSVFICPSGHGTLAGGKFLGQIEKASLDDEAQTLQLNTEHKLNCPHCQQPMTKVNYNYTGIIIDSCTSCHYRWLDTGEAKKIKDYKPDTKPEHLLAILELEDKTKKLAQQDSSDNIPKDPLRSSAAGGLVRGWASGDSRRTLSLLSGIAMWGLITGMIKSKFMRIVGPFFILVLITLGYLILKQMQQIDW